ncbi:MAG TPA: Rieske 2Fe-2S domain-containing protein, partial [Candidatus Acidoferrales bacterium]|nr:Rieske 2Fe-2S domain-containing protein [Candidatus Acidoferrales bacterium]
IALFNVGGEIFATGDSCPHAGSSLGWGKLDGKVVKCRAHGLCFDVTSGNIVGGSGLSIETYATRIEGDKIFVSPEADKGR